MTRLVIVFILSFSFLLIFPHSVFAAAQLSVDNIPLTIDQAQEFEIDISFSCSGCGDSYLRGVFYPSGSSYFGYTQDNAGNWSNAPGGSCTTYFKIAKTDLNPEGSWSGKLKFKPDMGSPYYSGPGEYLFKVGRYTPSCSSPSVWSPEKTIAITGPTPTPTQAPTSTSTPTSTKTPTPTPTKTNTPTPSPAKESQTGDEAENNKSFDNLSFAGDLTATPKDEDNSSESAKTLGVRENRVAEILIGLGIAFFISCGIVSFYIYRRNKTHSGGDI